MEKLKVIFHVDEMKKWDLTLGNVNNFIEGAEGDILVEVLANSEAVKAFDFDNEKNKLEEIKNLSEKNVVFYACENALKGNNISIEKLPEFIDTVPAGVVKLAERQKEGFSYIKP